MGRRINPKEAERILSETERPTKAPTLNTLRSTGGGPPFYKGKGKAVLYDVDDLLEWAKTDPMVKYNSTSEYSTRKRKNGGE